MAQTADVGAPDPNTAARPAAAPELIGTRPAPPMAGARPNPYAASVASLEKIVAEAQKRLSDAQAAADAEAQQLGPEEIDPVTKQPIPGSAKPFGVAGEVRLKAVETAQKYLDDYTVKLNDAKTKFQEAASASQPKVIASTTGKDSKYILTENPGGNPPIIKTLNDNYVETDANKNAYQAVHVGNKIVSVNNQTGEVKFGYTDQDAVNLAERQSRAAEANSRANEAQARAVEVAAQAKKEIDEMVAAGLDARSLREQKELEIRAAHSEWTRADGDAKSAREELQHYETERSNKATEELSAQQIQATKDWQAMQDATLRRGQDLEQEQSVATVKQNEMNTKAGMVNQRLSSGQGYLGNVMSTMAELNKTIEPGSDIVGQMFQPFMNMGQQFFQQMGGLENPYDPNSVMAPRVPNTPGPSNGTPVQNAAIQKAGEPTDLSLQPEDLATNPISPDGSPYLTTAALDEFRKNRQASTGLNTTGLAPIETAEQSKARNEANALAMGIEM